MQILQDYAISRDFQAFKKSLRALSDHHRRLFLWWFERFGGNCPTEIFAHLGDTRKFTQQVMAEIRQVLRIKDGPDNPNLKQLETRLQDLLLGSDPLKPLDSPMIMNIIREAGYEPEDNFAFFESNAQVIASNRTGFVLHMEEVVNQQFGFNIKRLAVGSYKGNGSAYQVLGNMLQRTPALRKYLSVYGQISDYGESAPLPQSFLETLEDVRRTSKKPRFTTPSSDSVRLFGYSAAVVIGIVFLFIFGSWLFSGSKSSDYKEEQSAYQVHEEIFHEQAPALPPPPVRTIDLHHKKMVLWKNPLYDKEHGVISFGFNFGNEVEMPCSVFDFNASHDDPNAPYSNKDSITLISRDLIADDGQRVRYRLNLPVPRKMFEKTVVSDIMLDQDSPGVVIVYSR